MLPSLYRELAPWYHLVDPVEGHRDEADALATALGRTASRPLETLLELGAGAGNNAFHLKRRLRCTLADLSPEMQALSRARNPECEHVLGDMRTLRLGRAFDAVLVHDAVCTCWARRSCSPPPAPRSCTRGPAAPRSSRPTCSGTASASRPRPSRETTASAPCAA